MKAIEFELLQSVCKHRHNEHECLDKDSYSGLCEHLECPIWSELVNSETEVEM